MSDRYPSAVSVIVPVFNGAALLADAVRSIREQDVPCLEIVVVDDGSTDDSAGVVAALGRDLRYVRQDHRGPAAARNAGVRVARGELLAFLDQDDLWPPAHLAVLLEALHGEPAAAVVMGLTQALRLVRRSDDGPVFERYGQPWLAPHVGSALFTRAALDGIGPFDERLEACSDDLDWFLRARERALSIVVLDAVTYLFRIHETNTSRDPALRRRALLEAVTASVRRRRSRGAHA